MKVFISWSGELSRKISEELKTWLQQCIQSLEVFYSKDDIEKGEFWSTRLSEELRNTNFGIVCLTSENINSPWIYFESGALSKMIESKVATIAVDMNITDIKGPLSRFQSTKLEKDDMYKLLESINTSISKPLDKKILEASFKAFWPVFEGKITSIIKTAKDDSIVKNQKINVPEAVEEILQLVRNQNVILNSTSTLMSKENLIRIIDNNQKIYGSDVDYILSELCNFTEHIVCRCLDYKKNFINIDEYITFIEHLVIDFPLWQKRFGRILKKLRYKTEEKIHQL